MTLTDLALVPDAAAPSRARAVLGTLLADRAGSEGFARAELALSEVVSNAVRHGAKGGSEAIRLLIERSDGLLSIRVIQSGPVPERPSVVEMPEPCAAGGYGLGIIDAVADRWGVRPDPPSVWFELQL